MYRSVFHRIALRIVGFFMNLYAVLFPKAAAHKAYQIFARTPKPVLRGKELQFMETARQVPRRAGEHEILEYHWGAEGNKWILLAYGWGYNAGRWRHFVPQLVEAGYRVIAYDPPGHGLNQRGDRFLNALINKNIQLDLIKTYGTPEVVIGHSFGGASAVMALRDLPRLQRPKRLVVMASFSATRPIFDEYRRALGLWYWVHLNFIRYIEQMIHAPLESLDMARQSAELDNVDGLLVHDPFEKVTRFKHAERYHSYWPGSALLRAPHAGHHLGKPEVTEAVIEFAIRGTLPREATFNTAPLAAGHDLVRYFVGLEH